MDWKTALAASAEITAEGRIPMSLHQGEGYQFDASVALVPDAPEEYGCRVYAVDEHFLHLPEEEVTAHLEAHGIDPTDGWK